VSTSADSLNVPDASTRPGCRTAAINMPMNDRDALKSAHHTLFQGKDHSQERTEMKKKKKTYHATTTYEKGPPVNREDGHGTETGTSTRKRTSCIECIAKPPLPWEERKSTEWIRQEPQCTTKNSAASL
jgi:hypothetical protein